MPFVARNQSSPTTSSRLRCKVCYARSHTEAGCARATTGLRKLIERATVVAEGRRYLLAEVIGVSEAGLSRALRANRLSFALRSPLVELVRAGELPDVDPIARLPGRRARASLEAQSVMLYFTAPEAEHEFLRLGRAHAAGRIGVLVDSVLAYREKHLMPPPTLDAAPARKVRCRIPKTEVDRRRELADFDAWIGGAEVRSRVISIVLAEHCQNASTIEMGGVVLALAQGSVEVYAAPTRRRRTAA